MEAEHGGVGIADTPMFSDFSTYSFGFQWYILLKKIACLHFFVGVIGVIGVIDVIDV